MHLSRRALAAAVSVGTVVRPYRGCYALPEATRAQVLSAMMRARITCVTALEAWDVPLLGADVSDVHLAVPRDRGITSGDARWQSDVVLHRGPALTGVRAVDMPTALGHAARCADFSTLLVATDYLLKAGSISRSALDAVPGVVGKRLRAMASAEADSPPETLARLALIEAGYQPRQQVTFTNIGRVDLVVNDSAVIEVDGRAYHSNPAAFVRDRRRDRALTQLGYQVLRFAAVEVLADRAIVARDVTAAVGPPRGATLARAAARRLPADAT